MTYNRKRLSIAMTLMGFVALCHARTITGHIYDSVTHDPIAGAVVSDTARKHATVSNADGYYSINVPSGTVALQVSIIGYQDQTIDIEETTVNLDVYMNRRENQLSEAVVTGQKNDKLHSPLMGMTNMSQGTIKNVPTVFGEADVIKALQLQPGVSAGIEGFAGMYVRGGNDDENLFMVDGNPIYRINHLGGLFSAFNVEAINEMSFYKAAFPARYGGRLSSVVDITTSDGDFTRYHGNFMIGLTSGNVSISGPIVKDRTSFSFSIRRSWLELISLPAIAIINLNEKQHGRKVIGGYSFTDINLKVSQHLGRYGQLSLSGYYGNDRLKVGEKEFSLDGDSEYYHTEDINRLSWGNALAVLQWDTRLGERTNFRLNASYTHYASGMAQSSDKTYGQEDDEDFSHTANKKDIDNGIDDIAVSASAIYDFNDRYRLRAGANFIHHRYTPESVQNQASGTGLQSSHTGTDEHMSANEAGFHLETDIEPISLLKVNAGLRLGLFGVNGKTYRTWEPRISARVMLSKTLSLKAAYSRMSQFVQQVSDNYISLPTDFYIPITDKFKPLTSDQYSLGLYYSLHDQYLFSAEGYYKTMNNLLEYKDGYNLMPASTHWSDKLTSGRGKAYGVDIMVEKTSGRLTGFLGYGLLWSDRHFAALNHGRNFPSKYDNRHKINLSLKYALTPKIDINAGWTYMTGNRITLSLENYQYVHDTGFPPSMIPPYPDKEESQLNFYNAKNNVRLPAYHRLDLGINFYRPMSKGRMGIWNISIYNAYSRMNPIVIQKSTQRMTMEGQALTPRFRSLAIFPIIPSVSYTYKF